MSPRQKGRAEAQHRRQQQAPHAHGDAAQYRMTIEIVLDGRVIGSARRTFAHPQGVIPMPLEEPPAMQLLREALESLRKQLTPKGSN